MLCEILMFEMLLVNACIEQWDKILIWNARVKQ
jgi:hypothetical protein